MVFSPENVSLCIDIEENGVCVGKASPEIESRKYRLFVFKDISVAYIKSNQG